MTNATNTKRGLAGGELACFVSGVDRFKASVPRMPRSTDRCARILDLIDRCLADLDPARPESLPATAPDPAHRSHR